jgi:Arc/MetJ-type ribon-helix-helix transcriptional regulator
LNGRPNAKEPTANCWGYTLSPDNWERRDLRNVDLMPDQRALVRRAVDCGGFSHEEEAVQEALALWEERERTRLEVLASLDEAEASLSRGEGRSIMHRELDQQVPEARAVEVRPVREDALRERDPLAFKGVPRAVKRDDADVDSQRPRPYTLSAGWV